MFSVSARSSWMFHTLRRSQKELRPVVELATGPSGWVIVDGATTFSWSRLPSLGQSCSASFSFVARFLLGAGASELLLVEELAAGPFRLVVDVCVSWTSRSVFFSLGQAFSSSFSFLARFFLGAAASADALLDVGHRWRLVL